MADFQFYKEKLLLTGISVLSLTFSRDLFNKPEFCHQYPELFYVKKQGAGMNRLKVISDSLHQGKYFILKDSGGEINKKKKD